MIPRSLGPYEIRATLGRGGMGEVYLAEDPRLGRSVAIKVLPASADAGAVGRFLREARTAAALQHPHIAVLHDVGEDQGLSYIVMERLDGETLDHALTRGPMHWKEVLRLAEQLASALGHAHGHGVLHRDLKPANIMLCPGRGAVLLDFGLAQRVLFREASASEQTETETLDVGRFTRAGTVVGTMAYMSPEQLQDRALDARSDLFQLGLTLFEAAAGQHAFRGATNVDIMHGILRTPNPPLREVARVPDELSRIVGKLLEKDPEYRYPDARALEADLRGLLRSSASLEVPLLPPRARAMRLRRPGVVLAAAAVVLAGAAALSMRFWREPAVPVPVRLVPLTHGEGNANSPSLSPDGASVVFASDRGGNWDLWVGLLTGDPPVRITDTPESESQPEWSPDGARVAFVRRRLNEPGSDIYVMPALGGHARRLVEEAVDPAWSPDGRLLAFAELYAGWSRIATVALEGSEPPRPVTPFEEGYFQRGPSWTPDGRALVFNRSPGGYVGQLMRVERDGGTPQPLTHDPRGIANISAEVTADGNHVVHVSDRGGALNLWRIPLAGGPPQRLTSGPGQDFEPSVSADGRRIAFVNTPLAFRLLEVPLAEDEARTIASFEGGEAWAPDLSPDGAQVAFSYKVPGRPWRPALLPRAGGTPRALLEGQPDVFWVRFSRSPGRLLFDARGPDGARIGSVLDDGTGLVWLTPAEEDASYPDLSRDGSLLAYVRGHGPNAGDIVLCPATGGAGRVLVPQATLPRFSPDGRRLAFARSRSYAGGVGVVELDRGEVLWLTSSGTWPTWLPDGRGIAFADVGPDGAQLAWTVDVAGGAPRRLGRFRWQGTHFPYVVSADGARLISSDSAGAKSTLWLAEF